MKHIIFGVSVLMIGVALADLAYGQTSNPILPDFIGNELDQEKDLALVGLGGAGLWYSITQFAKGKAS